ncbi:MAG TPA: FxLYD domain-containing protein [Mucilaginibacter sp.]|nr:FxLYD domain-containing protein [Mucilaginibacter sp.]
MKTLNTILLALLCLFYSCKQPVPATAKRSTADSLEIVAKATKLAQEMVQRAKDSVANTQPGKAATVHIEKSYGPCPAAVKECLITTDSHGKSIIVTLKNNSKKKIDMVGVSWTVYNKQGKKLGSSSGKARKLLANGRSASYSWGINAETGTRAKASIYSIHYKDGTVWLSGEGS